MLSKYKQGRRTFFLPPDPASPGSVVMEAFKAYGAIVDDVAAGLDWRTRRAHAAARSTACAFAVTTTGTSGVIDISRHNVGQPGFRYKCVWRLVICCEQVVVVGQRRRGVVCKLINCAEF
jgi:hypothetical protein